MDGRQVWQVNKSRLAVIGHMATRLVGGLGPFNHRTINPTWSMAAIRFETLRK